MSDIITTTTLNLTLPLVTITTLPPYSARNEKTDWSISVRPVKKKEEEQTTLRGTELQFIHVTISIFQALMGEILLQGSN